MARSQTGRSHTRAAVAALFLAAGFGILGERRPLVLAPVAGGTALGFWVVFELLDVKLDWGVFGRISG